HHARRQMAESLAEQVGADALFMDEGAHGSYWNHKRALSWAAHQRARTWVLEDDAIVDKNFRERALEWSLLLPHELISGYLGMSRPPRWQRRIGAKIHDAEQEGRDFITLPQLIHGVCYSVPSTDVGRVLRAMSPGPADYSVGDAWGHEVFYPI